MSERWQKQVDASPTVNAYLFRARTDDAPQFVAIEPPEAAHDAYPVFYGLVLLCMTLKTPDSADEVRALQSSRDARAVTRRPPARPIHRAAPPNRRSAL